MLRAAAGILILCVSTAATCVPYQNVGIESTPAAADVYLDGELVGVTPLRIRIPTGTDHSVFLKKEGYQSRMLVLDQNRPADGIDFLTPADLRVRLVPLTGPPDREVEVEIEKEKPD